MTYKIDERFTSLGWAIVRTMKPQYGQPSVMIITPSQTDDGVFIPAQSIEVYGSHQIKALEDAIHKLVIDIEVQEAKNELAS